MTTRLTQDNVTMINALATQGDFYAKAHMDVRDELIAIRAGKEGKLFTARAASTGNVASISGLSAIDTSVTPVAGDVILLKNQNTGSQNGLYVAASGAWSRLKDGTGAVVMPVGAEVTVLEGTVNADTKWLLTTNAPFTVGTDGLTFAQLVTTGVSAVDLASTAGGSTGAALVGIADAGLYTSAVTAEAALQELYAANASRFRVSTTVTTVEAVAGKELIADALVTSKKVYIENIMLTVGGATAWSGALNNVLITDQAGSPVTIVTIPKGGLTGNVVIPSLASASFTVAATAITGGTTSKGIKIITDGATAAGSDITITVTGRIL